MFRRFFTWLRERRCSHAFIAVAHTPVSNWHPSPVGFSGPQGFRPDGTVRAIRIHMQCPHCGARALVQGAERELANGYHMVDFVTRDLAILQSR
jgi:hypothetical protein